MKIIYLASAYHIHDKKFIQGLKQLGYSLDVFIIKPQKINNSLIIDDVNHYTPFNFDIKFKPLFLFAYLLSFIVIFVKLRIILSDKSEKYLLRGGNVLTSGLLSSLLNYHPFLLMPIGSDILIDPDKSIVSRLIVKYVIKTCDYIFVDSRALVQKIIEMDSSCSGKVENFPWGIDPAVFYPGYPNTMRIKYGLENKFVVICDRKHEEIYGVQNLIRMMPAIIAEDRDIVFLLIGRGPLSYQFKKYVVDKKIEDNVIFVDEASNDLIPYYLCSSDLYVSLSYSDGTSVSLLEAIGCGLPLMISDIPSNKYLCDWGLFAYYVNNEDEINVKNIILYLKRNERILKKLSTMNDDFRKKYIYFDYTLGKLDEIIKKIT